MELMVIRLVLVGLFRLGLGCAFLDFSHVFAQESELNAPQLATWGVSAQFGFGTPTGHLGLLVVRQSPEGNEWDNLNPPTMIG
jgi:hypothetical protein